MFNLQGGEIVIILLLALVVLGPEKLPDAMRKAGEMYAEFRKVSGGFQDEFRKAIDEPMNEVRKTADTLRDSADFRKLSDGERPEKPKSGTMADASSVLPPQDPDEVPNDDFPHFQVEGDDEGLDVSGAVDEDDLNDPEYGSVIADTPAELTGAPVERIDFPDDDDDDDDDDEDRYGAGGDTDGAETDEPTSEIGQILDESGKMFQEGVASVQTEDAAEIAEGVDDIKVVEAAALETVAQDGIAAEGADDEATS